MAAQVFAEKAHLPQRSYDQGQAIADRGSVLKVGMLDERRGGSGREQVRHDVGGVVAGVIEAGQLERSLKRFQQGEVSIEVRALDAALLTVVGIHNHHDLVDVRRKAVVVRPT